MAFQRRGFGAKKTKGNYVTVGNLWKTSQDKLHENAKYSYSGTCSGEYLEKVLKALEAAYNETGAARFSLTLWRDKEQPSLTVSPAQSKDGGKANNNFDKRIRKAKNDSFHDGQDRVGNTPEEGEDIG